MTTSQHIVKAYDEELRDIGNRIVEMGGVVETQLADAMEAIARRNADLGARAAARDAEVDAFEREIDAKILSLLARRQPMADDLREMISALRIIGILERVGDYASHVGERAAALAAMPALPPTQVVARMGRMVRDLIADVLEAYARRDADLALAVWRRDRALDQLYASLVRELLQHMSEDAASVVVYTHLLFMAKYVERIGDFATNIAEHVHFIVRGFKPEGSRPKAAGTGGTLDAITDETPKP